jgi:hypothetical protein
MGKSIESQPYDPFHALPKKRRLADAGDIRSSKRSSTQILKNSGTPVKTLAKSRDAEYTKFTAYIPIGLHRSVKSKLVGRGEEMSALVEQLLREWDARQ